MTSPATFATDLFVPAYRPMASGAWSLDVAPFALAPGYWSAPMLVHDMAALVRDGSTWMSITPMEIESQEIGVRAARGHVLIFGLGLGWAALASACLPAVERVTVVERDPDVLALHQVLDLPSQLPDAARAKLRIVQGDAYTYVPDTPVDLLMPDIWLPIVSDGRVDEVRRMQANVSAQHIYFWGQELEIARHAIAAGRLLNDSGIAATIADSGLPLIGPDLPDYTDKLIASSRQWQRGRWLPGVTPPW